jgi:hypothetical protein
MLLSRSARVAFSRDDQLAEEFEQLLRQGPTSEALQDRLMSALRWTEGGQLVSTMLMKQLEMQAKQVLRTFLEEQPPYTAMAGTTPCPSCADDLQVVHDGQGRITIELPNEVRRWLLQTQSMISS